MKNKKDIKLQGAGGIVCEDRATGVAAETAKEKNRYRSTPVGQNLKLLQLTNCYVLTSDNKKTLLFIMMCSGTIPCLL